MAALATPLLVYVPAFTPRLQYAFQLVLGDTAGIPYRLTSQRDEFLNYSGPRFSYSDMPLADELNIVPHKLLFEKGIRQQAVSVFQWQGIPAIFGTSSDHRWPFDVFAASFYLATRYEEYMPHVRDQYDRFEAESSLAFQKNFLTRPLVNIWVKQLKTLLRSLYPQWNITDRQYRFISTLDIDNAWAFRQKGIVRTAGAFARDLFNLDLTSVLYRLQVLSGLKQDPFDTYGLQIELQKKYKFPAIYFVLLGKYGENDKNISPSNRAFRSLIKFLADYARVGIHPSYGSNRDPMQLKREIQTLSTMLKREVTCSRQHFLILRLPATYRQLISLDITDDYSMGYAHHTGFRASLCTPFYFYDLDQEQTTPLRIHPFAVMDATLKYYMKVMPENAMDYIKPLIDEVKAVGGDFISLWHNESLSEYKQWKGWSHVYIDLIEKACP
jgi:hypothetical protein